MDFPDLPPANKRLGQNFLIDPNIVRKIVALAEVTQETQALEIGPGRGILTEALCKAAGQVTAVEIDPRLHAYLAGRQAEFPNLTLVLGDALIYSFAELPVGTVVVANLPYYISTPLLFRLLEHRDRIPRMVLMLQNEVADRLAAKPGTSDYGVLSVMTQYAADITKAFRVSAQCFRPRPEVGSAVVLLRTKERRELNREEEPKFAALVKAAFAHRRKTLVNSLRDEGYDQAQVTEGLVSLNLPPSTRAEVLALDQFMRLTRAIASRY
ncbi:16S rRNA (adenine(1518)-N(6)/adenine(1519)-N(6))-dimethyltransferase RsmA [Nitrospira sp. NS4]|uniref:16S rRNA (adenine(1518)-N(6)/adenine(1519)-N(6))- dimethyltransferase RsmA n=1 Tax=Nitrospira sp. NS4 TaxID=3414498 RepID=UPI003C2E66F2